MKTKSILLAGLLSLLGASAFAQTSPVDQVKQDNRQIRQENREIARDNRAIGRDNVAIGQDKQAVGQEKQQINAERAERNSDQRREDRDVKNGDLAGAQKMDAARRQEPAKRNVSSCLHNYPTAPCVM